MDSITPLLEYLDRFTQENEGFLVETTLRSQFWPTCVNAFARMIADHEIDVKVDSFVRSTQDIRIMYDQLIRTHSTKWDITWIHDTSRGDNEQIGNVNIYIDMWRETVRVKANKNTHFINGAIHAIRDSGFHVTIDVEGESTRTYDMMPHEDNMRQPR